jgi:cytochrome b
VDGKRVAWRIPSGARLPQRGTWVLISIEKTKISGKMRARFSSTPGNFSAPIEPNQTAVVGWRAVLKSRYAAAGEREFPGLTESIKNRMQRENDKIEEVTTSVRVWDRFVRVFHWTMALGFAAAFVSGEMRAMTLHVLIGYVLCVLLLARVYWGFKGSQYARFRSFIFPLGETHAYIRGMFRGDIPHYFGHNPAGALMVFATLGMLAAILVTGLLTLATIDYEGPLLFLANRVSDETSYAFRRIHEFLPIVGLVLVVLHLLGVAVGSIQHKENLVRAMLTGKKKMNTPSNSTH